MNANATKRYIWSIYMTIPSPYLKLEKSEALTDPEAVKVTFGAISLMREAEMVWPAPYLALTVPKGALYAQPSPWKSQTTSPEWVVCEATERSLLTL